MKKPGRPPKPADERRDALIRLRVKVVDRDLMQGAAEHAGLSLSAWARRLLLKAARLELRRK